MEIASISADTIGCEQGVHKETGAVGVLHSALLCNLGVIFNEIVWLKDLAEDCAKDGQYTFLFARRSSKTSLRMRIGGQSYRN